MRSRAMSMILAALAAAACAPPAPAGQPSPIAEAPPVRALLSERERLSLSSEQVVALDSLSREFDVAGRGMSRRLSLIKGGLLQRLAGEPDRPLARVADSHRRAIQAVERVLRPEQRARLCELQAARQQKEALRQDKRSLQGRTLASSPPGRRAAERTWPWCSGHGPAFARTVQAQS
ncbi:MAG: hypothetical protein KY467_11780 [Gemmatimonadetes bacterium]|nr:hypothetical protein [Gemmatimonadota bacterium]